MTLKFYGLPDVDEEPLPLPRSNLKTTEKISPPIRSANHCVLMTAAWNASSSPSRLHILSKTWKLWKKFLGWKTLNISYKIVFKISNMYISTEPTWVFFCFCFCGHLFRPKFRLKVVITSLNVAKPLNRSSCTAVSRCFYRIFPKIQVLNQSGKIYHEIVANRSTTISFLLGHTIWRPSV